ncbi:hypothetical protein Q6D62_02465 [Corynebacterium diphtheriae]|nr:type IIL restriction-modification enzyme MmeI [Corynebacterium diphtheriae]AEX47987.1 hypothetical protein CDBH8_0462 [Corynebacterium diphtheriae BH8]AEX69171.1 hypothetical protein CDPW8_0509 [Corynebacterium diphtheriae PW8]MDZ5308426.1 hypothetical protein [Corynebacterium diphtheriae]OKY24488.1 hypothetical protein AO271_00910 [Corynebacterium diphtheriae]TBX18740.1 hypothetical protein BUW94_05190 [Corynebacterium diphtheriae]
MFALMFPMIFELGIEIGYAYTSFKWENNAKFNAGVTVVVVGFRNRSNRKKYLYKEGVRQEVGHLNGYLSAAPDVFVERRKKPFGDLPQMSFGSMPRDGGHLSLTSAERDLILGEHPEAEQFVKRFVGSAEFINSIERYCFWISESKQEEACAISFIKQRLEQVAAFRLTSKAPSTVKYAQRPGEFVQRAYKPTNSIIVPRVSSERREYIPIGYLGPDTVISDAAFAVYDAEPWLFALLTSKMHMVWVRAVGGKMKTDYRYSNTIVYNNFPVPELSTRTKADLTTARSPSARCS